MAFSQIFASLRTVPPGNVWTGAHFLACFILLGGSAVCARWERSRWVFLAYGFFGSLPFIQILLPDSRDMSRIAYGSESIWFYICATCGFVVFCCLGCRGLATLTWQVMDGRRKAREQIPKCLRCGYLLYGLPEDRCPECGTFFDGPPPKPPDAGADHA